jgi:hypothetical protein
MTKIEEMKQTNGIQMNFNTYAMKICIIMVVSGPGITPNKHSRIWKKHTFWKENYGLQNLAKQCLLP